VAIGRLSAGRDPTGWPYVHPRNSYRTLNDHPLHSQISAPYFRFVTNKTFARLPLSSVTSYVIFGYLFSGGSTGGTGVDSISSKCSRNFAIAQVWLTSCASSFGLFH
jgi:hypothetical protein